MKKTKFLSLVLVVAIMMMGAGYAYWTETLTINNTVTTGMLDFIFKEAGVKNQSKGMDYNQSSLVEVTNPENDDSSLSVQLNDMYPGASATIFFEIKNNGTMEGKLRNFKIEEFKYAENIFVTSLSIDGEPKLAEDRINILELDDELEKLKLTIDRNNYKKFEISLFIDHNADETKLPENLGRNSNTEPIKFTLTANGVQYNDERFDVSNPVISGIEIEDAKVVTGSNLREAYVSANIIPIYNDGTKGDAVPIYEKLSRLLNGTAIVKYDIFTITFVTDRLGNLTYTIQP